jgi:hypothetical protein
MLISGCDILTDPAPDSVHNFYFYAIARTATAAADRQVG